MKHMNLNATLDDIKDALEESNDKYFVIKNHLFTIDKITTLIPFHKVYSFDGHELEISFSFSYNDLDRSLIKVSINFEPTSCLNFIADTNMLTDAQIEKIYDKIKEYVGEKENDQECSITDIVNHSDEIAYNEALINLLNGINKDDCDQIKNDFSSKFDLWKKMKNEANEKIRENIVMLYTMLLERKKQR